MVKDPVDFRSATGVVGGILAALNPKDRKEYERLVKNGMTPYNASQQVLKERNKRVDKVLGL